MQDTAAITPTRSASWARPTRTNRRPLPARQFFWRACCDGRNHPDAHVRPSVRWRWTCVLRSPAGLAGVWAEENTRESIFNAMQRKETFAVSGPHIKVRFFGGWQYTPEILDGQATG